jgi:hypothetical protein
MPRIEPPIIAGTELPDIELFALAYFNLRLTSWQLKFIEAMSKGQTLHGGKAVGKTTATKVMRAYIAEGLKPGGRRRLPQHPLPPVDKKKFKGVTQEGRILNMIMRPGGAYNFELSRFALKYTSVISALRKDGHDIVADRQYLKNGKPSNTWRYRIGGQ